MRPLPELRGQSRRGASRDTSRARLDALGSDIIYEWSLVPLLLEGVDADGVLEDDGAPLGVVVELHRVVVDGAGVVGGVHQQLAIVRVQRVEVKPCDGK